MIAPLLATVSKGDLVFVIMKFYETLISHIISLERAEVSMKKHVSREKSEGCEEQVA